MFALTERNGTMKSRISQNTKKELTTAPCYYMPKTFLTDNRLSAYSLDSKLLTGIILSVADNGEAIVEAAELINALGVDYLNKAISDLKGGANS